MLSDTSRTAATALAVAAGGAVGAACRYQIWRWWPDDTMHFPLTTFAINVVGCFLLGLSIGAIPDGDQDLSAIVRAFLTYGTLSGFTSFGFFAVQGVTLTYPGMGLLYLALTPVVAVGLAWAGRACWSTLSRRSRRAGRHAR
ncbi:putative camphor resistance protein CrcB [Rhodococcus wratislaviensis IFP 2016]|nr:putative camphor resistance protein CrcB [Rhodococcus wratislaviensis IFP 2016]NKY69811.1 CrcB family protein [Rhodococcus opacus]CAG7600048.1 Putative fluoride ion transporter CrcB [Rhodococcus opacus]